MPSPTLNDAADRGSVPGAILSQARRGRALPGYNLQALDLNFHLKPESSDVRFPQQPSDVNSAISLPASQSATPGSTPPPSWWSASPAFQTAAPTSPSVARLGRRRRRARAWLGWTPTATGWSALRSLRACSICRGCLACRRRRRRRAPSQHHPPGARHGPRRPRPSPPSCRPRPAPPRRRPSQRRARRRPSQRRARRHPARHQRHAERGTSSLPASPLPLPAVGLRAPVGVPTCRWFHRCLPCSLRFVVYPSSVTRLSLSLPFLSPFFLSSFPNTTPSSVPSPNLHPLSHPPLLTLAFIHHLPLSLAHCHPNHQTIRCIPR